MNMPVLSCSCILVGVSSHTLLTAQSVDAVNQCMKKRLYWVLAVFEKN